MEALIIEYAKRYGIQKAIEYFGLDKQNANPKYAISLGNFSFDPVGAAKRAVLNTGLKSAFSGNLSGIMGPAVMLGGALMLGRAFDPMRQGSLNYSPNLRGQVDFLSRQPGMLSTNQGTGGMVYGPNSVLAGQNVSSMFGTNNYQQQLDSAVEAFEDDDNPLELFLIYGAKGLERYLKQSPKLARDTLVNQYLEAARDRDYIFTPAIPGRPTELVPFNIKTHKDLLDAGPSAYSFIYQLLYVDEIFTVGDKVAVYDGDLESPNVIHTYEIKTANAQK